MSERAPLEKLVAYEYETDRTLAGSSFPHGEHEYTKEGGPLPGPDKARLLPDKITVRGMGAYYPSVGLRADGLPDWTAYFRAVDGLEPMVYVWRDEP